MKGLARQEIHFEPLSQQTPENSRSEPPQSHAVARHDFIQRVGAVQGFHLLLPEVVEEGNIGQAVGGVVMNPRNHVTKHPGWKGSSEIEVIDPLLCPAFRPLHDLEARTSHAIQKIGAGDLLRQAEISHVVENLLHKRGGRLASVRVRVAEEQAWHRRRGFPNPLCHAVECPWQQLVITVEEHHPLASRVSYAGVSGGAATAISGVAHDGQALIRPLSDSSLPAIRRSALDNYDLKPRKLLLETTLQSPLDLARSIEDRNHHGEKRVGTHRGTPVRLKREFALSRRAA